MINKLNEMRKNALLSKDTQLKTVLTLLYDKAQKSAKKDNRDLEDKDIEHAAAFERKQADEALKEGAITDEQHAFMLEVYSNFLPEALTEAEAADIIKSVIEESQTKDFGKVMKAAKSAIGTRYDGKQLADLVKKTLN